jgi:hypothetical protein
MMVAPQLMRQFTIILALCLCTLTLACKRPDPIRLQPTFEEPAALASMIRISDTSTSKQLVRGFYVLEQQTWRWTAPRFTVALQSTPNGRENGAWLVLQFHVHEATLAASKKITIHAKLGDAILEPETLTAPGEYEYRREVPASAFTKDVVYADFNVDGFVTPEGDNRQLSLIVTAVGLESK